MVKAIAIGLVSSLVGVNVTLMLIPTPLSPDNGVAVYLIVGLMSYAVLVLTFGE